MEPALPSLPRGPVHLLFVRVTDVFQMMVSHVSWTSTKAPPWETARRYTPSDGENLHGPSSPALPGSLQGSLNTRGRGCQGGLPGWWKHLARQRLARTQLAVAKAGWKSAVWSAGAGRFEVVLVAATIFVFFFFYSSDININMDGKFASAGSVPQNELK